MARTVRQAITTVRGLIQDEGQPFRISNTALASYVSEALGEVRRVRPDLFLYSQREATPFYTVEDLDKTLPIPDMYFAPLVNYVAGRSDLREDQFTQDGRAMALINAFAVALRGAGQ